MKITKKGLWDFTKITAATILLIIGNYFFKFPNNYVFGGVTGIAVIAGSLFKFSVGRFNMILNILFLVIGFVFLGKSFGIKTVYTSILLSAGISLLEKVMPLTEPLTSQPMLEFVWCLLLTSVAGGILFQCEASSGGTDIVALILKKFTGRETGKMLLITDILIVITAFWVFDMQTALFSCLGLIIKSSVIDNTIASMNKCKYVNVICDDADIICEYVINTLKKGATVTKAEGAYTKKEKYIVMCVLHTSQEIKLRRFINEHEPTAFILVSNSSEIFGKGFLPFGN